MTLSPTAGNFVEDWVVHPNDVLIDTASALDIGGATVHRIRGSLAIVQLSTTLTSQVVVWIRERALNETSGDPGNVVNLQDDDIMWYRAFALQPVLAGASSTAINLEVDVRVKRRLEHDHGILIAVSNAVGGGDVSGIWKSRSLLAYNL